MFFLTFKESLLAFNHMHIFANSFFSSLYNFFYILKFIQCTGKAYNINLNRSLESAMSLIYIIINRSGPKIDPWGHQLFDFL